MDDDRVDDVDVDVEVEGAGSKSSTRISQAPAFVSPSTLPRGTSHRDAPISTRMQSICELLESAAMHYCPQVISVACETHKKNVFSSSARLAVDDAAGIPSGDEIAVSIQSVANPIQSHCNRRPEERSIGDSRYC